MKKYYWKNLPWLIEYDVILCLKTTSIAFKMIELFDSDYIGLKKPSCGLVFECAFVQLTMERE